MRGPFALPTTMSPGSRIEETESRMAEQTGTLQLTDEDVAYLLTLLRNAPAPLRTGELVEALKQRSRR